MRVRITEDGDIGFNVQRWDWWLPIWRTAYGRILSIDSARKLASKLLHPFVEHIEAVAPAAPRAVTGEEDSILRAAILGGSTLVAKGRSCHCQACEPQGNGFDTPMRMILCAICGNKRCPHAADHRNACTNSNEPGQKGSSWESVRSLATPTEGKT